MKSKILRTIVLFGLVAILALSFSCGKKKPVDDNNGGGGGNDNPPEGKTTYTITYNLNGGTQADGATTSFDGSKGFVLPTPTYEGHKFEGWFEDANFTGTKVTAVPKGTTGNKTYYAKWSESAGYSPKWDLNQIGFQGNGMEIVIQCLPVASYDPFNANYTQSDKSVKQKHQQMVEAAYGVKIKYLDWPDEASWGPNRVQYIIDSQLVTSQFKQNNVYVCMTITNQWIPTLVKSEGVLAQLYNTRSKTGYFDNMGYEQSAVYNQACSVNGKVYGMCLGSARPDTFMYYNATLCAQIGMEEPAEMYFKGNWKWSTFVSWVEEAQTKLADGQYVIDCGYPEFVIAETAAQGNKMVNTNSGALYMTKTAVTSIFDQMKTWYNNGFWNPKHSVQTVATQFIEGTTIFHDGSIGYLKFETRFEPSIEFEIGVVPYPMANDSVATPYTSPYTYEDTEGNKIKVNEPLVGRNGEVIKDASGNPIYGIDLSSSTYTIPFTTCSPYGILDRQNGENGINSEIVLNIVYDLFGGQGADPDKEVLTSDESYRTYLKTKLDSDIYVEVIMSVQDPSLSYYEIMETLSMTVGSGSHFGPDAFWMVAPACVTQAGVTPAVKLAEVEHLYKEALQELGY